MRRTALYPLALCAVLLACVDQEGDADVVRTDSAGIEIVTSSGTDRILSWRVAEAALLAGGEADTLLTSAADRIRLGVDATNRIYVLDPGAARLLAFSPDGAFDGVVARSGAGPGEIEYPERLAVAPSGEVSISDFAKRAVVRIGADGEALPSRSFADLGGLLRDMAQGAGMSAYSVRERDRDGGKISDELYIAVSGDTALVATVSEENPRQARFESCRVIMVRTPLFAPSLEWALRDSMLAVSSGPEYRVDVYHGHTLVRSVRRRVPVRAVTEALARAEVGDGMPIGIDDQTCIVPTDEVIAEQGFAAAVQPVSELAIMPDGSLWIQRRVVGDETPLIDVFDPVGDYVGTLAGARPFPGAVLSDGRFAAVTVDSLGLPRVAIYSVERLNNRSSDAIPQALPAGQGRDRARPLPPRELDLRG